MVLRNDDAPTPLVQLKTSAEVFRFIASSEIYFRETRTFRKSELCVNVSVDKRYDLSIFVAAFLDSFVVFLKHTLIFIYNFYYSIN